MVRPGHNDAAGLVAPLAGSVDRNWHKLIYRLYSSVAPLAGSVDRNFDGPITQGHGINVAPLAGSVDRNGALGGRLGPFDSVAPLAGSVDRNWTIRSASSSTSCRSPRGERG